MTELERWQRLWRIKKALETSPPGTFSVDWLTLTLHYIGPGSEPQCKARITPTQVALADDPGPIKAAPPKREDRS